MQYTEKLNLKMPDYDDIADIEAINNNMKVLDKEVSETSQRSIGNEVKHNILVEQFKEEIKTIEKPEFRQMLKGN